MQQLESDGVLEACRSGDRASHLGSVHAVLEYGVLIVLILRGLASPAVLDSPRVANPSRGFPGTPGISKYAVGRLPADPGHPGRPGHPSQPGRAATPHRQTVQGSACPLPHPSGQLPSTLAASAWQPPLRAQVPALLRNPSYHRWQIADSRVAATMAYVTGVSSAQGTDMPPRLLQASSHFTVSRLSSQPSLERSEDRGPGYGARKKHTQMAGAPRRGQQITWLR